MKEENLSVKERNLQGIYNWSAKYFNICAGKGQNTSKFHTVWVDKGGPNPLKACTEWAQTAVTPGPEG